MTPKSLTRRTKSRSVTASSVDMSGLITKSSWDIPGRQKAWQREIYRLTEIVGELRSAAKLIGTAASKARLYIADLDEDGEIRGETENVKAQRICRRIFGGGDRREEELRILAMNLFLVGDGFIWGRTDDSIREREAWRSLSINSFTREGGKLYTRLEDGKNTEILPGDILRRVIIPDPQKRWLPDSAPKANRVVLQELEQLTKYVFTQIDSRLISAGLLPWPNGTMTSGSDNTIGTNIMKQIMDLAAKANDGTGTSAAAVPLIVDVPPDAIGKIQVVNFQSELSRIAGQLREEGVKRLANGLDIAPEQLLGSTGDTNHWTVWYIDESAVKIHVEPILHVMCGALDAAWALPALEKSGLDPERYCLAADTSTLTVRPQRLKETLDLYNQGLVSAQAVLEAGAYRTGDAPDKVESAKRFLRELTLRYPQLIDQPEMREAMDLGKDIIEVSPAPMVEAAGPPPPPAPEQLPGKGQPPGIPDTQGNQGGKAPAGLTASAATDGDVSPLLVLADCCAMRTLELAGGRLLTRANRNQYKDTPRWQLYQKIWVDPAKVESLTASAASTTVELASKLGVEDPERFANVIDAYCRYIMVGGKDHNLQNVGVALGLGGYHAF